MRAGKVRYVGCSNLSGWHMMKAMEVARRDGRIPFVSEQIHYTLQAREAEYELLPVAARPEARRVWCGARSRAACCRASIAATRRRRKARARSRAGRSRRFATRTRCGTSSTNSWRSAKAHGVSGAQIALAWLLGRPAVTSLIIGGRTEAQFKDNLASVNVKLTDEERARLDKVSQPPLDLPLLASVLDREGPPRGGGISRCMRLF